MAQKKKAPVERTFVSASSGKKTSAPVKTKKPVVRSETVEEQVESTKPIKKTGKSSVPYRIFAVICWLLAITAEVLVILLLNGVFYIPADAHLLGLPISEMTAMIAGIVIDLILVIVGSLLWKKANRISPASRKNKFLFFLWNQMGVIAAILAFVPLVIFLLKDKDLDPKTKKIVTIIAAVALVIASLFSIDYNPVAKEDFEGGLFADTVYWTQFGKSYHLDPDCHTLLRSKTIYEGSVDEAYDANRTDPCDFCAMEEDGSIKTGNPLASGEELDVEVPEDTDLKVVEDTAA